MEKFKNKLKDRGGFTLIEMLIVVAIIAILIAVSIPLVNSALERAREATDAANERSFKAVLLLSYTLGEYENTSGSTTAFTPGDVYVYDAAEGILKSSLNKGYGKSTEYEGADDELRKGLALAGGVGDDGKVVMGWYDPSGNEPATLANVGTLDNLIGPLLTTE